MPTFRKVGKNWRAEVARKGIRKSATFPSKGAAQHWAWQQESAILGGDRGEVPNKTFGDLLIRYGETVSPKKKGARWEKVRLGLLGRDPLALVRLRHLSGAHVAQWRDRRLQAVSGASVRREWNLLSHACNIAIREWHWLKANPFKGIDRPANPEHRTRRATDDERARLAEVAQTPARRRVLEAFLFAEECAMRAGEICKASVSGSVASLEDTKNGTRRLVPLSDRAIALYGAGFALTPAAIDANWRAMTKEAGIKDLHFHDSRREAITRLAKKLNVLQLARVVGHKNLKMLQIYYDESAEDLAKLL